MGHTLVLGWQEEVCMERGQRSRERSSWSPARSRAWPPGSHEQILVGRKPFFSR